MRDWIVLIAAILFEAAGTTSMKLSQGMTNVRSCRMQPGEQEPEGDP